MPVTACVPHFCLWSSPALSHASSCPPLFRTFLFPCFSLTHLPLSFFPLTPIFHPLPLFSLPLTPPCSALSSASGEVILPGLPPGQHTISLWQTIFSSGNLSSSEPSSPSLFGIDQSLTCLSSTLNLTLIERTSLSVTVLPLDTPLAGGAGYAMHWSQLPRYEDELTVGKTVRRRASERELSER